MITPFFADIRCRCGRRHHVPVDPDGHITFVCGSLRRTVTLTLNQTQLHAALARTTSEQLLAVDEGVCVVHRAAAPEHDQQRCADCGWLLLSYAFFLAKHFDFPLIEGKRRDDVEFWKPDALVGRTNRNDYYLAQDPMTPHRERRCFTKVA